MEQSRSLPCLHTGQPLPDRLLRTIARWNQPGLIPDWLTTIPAAVEAFCKQWQITLEPAIPDTAMTLVLPGISETLGPVMIKASPLADEIFAEAAALQLGAGPQTVRLHALADTPPIMLLERVLPGTPLISAGLPDEQATRIMAEAARSFWRSVTEPAGLRPLRDWLSELFAPPPGAGALDTDLLLQAQTEATRLLAEAGASCLLHGDLQHQNLLLRTADDWVIIDPKGLMGDPGFEIAAWMYNPPGIALDRAYSELAAHRLQLCADIWQIDRRRLARWAFVGAMISVCWSIGDDDADEWIRATLAAARALRDLVD